MNTAVKSVLPEDGATAKPPVIKAGASGEYDDIAPADFLKALDVSGAVLLRGFNGDLQRFEIFTRSFCSAFHTVGTRKKYRPSEGDERTTQVPAANITILSHTEGTFRPTKKGFPDLCFFMCVMPPAEAGGETTVLDGIKFLKRLPAALRKRFEEQGIIYEMLWDKKRWQDEFDVENVEELKAWLDRVPDIKFTLEGEMLHLFFKIQAVTRSRSGDLVFAPGLLAHIPRITHPGYLDKHVHTKPTNRIYFGDGVELSDDEINLLIDIQDGLVYPHVWQAGDMLVIDNTRCLHGRTMTEKPCERTLISRFGWLSGQ